MTRNGKIARLPRGIRDELNRRLDNGETGVRLLEWLNGLPEVKQVLDRDFEGREINDQNLSDWKSGGFADWQGQQQALAMSRELMANGKELAAVSGGELMDCLAAVVAARYAAALYGWNGEMTDEMRNELRGLKALSREVARLRRSEQSAERLKLDREWLALGRQKTEDGMKKRLYQLCEDHDFQDKITPKMTRAERARKIREILGFWEDDDPKADEAQGEGSEDDEEPPWRELFS
jgi:hypothetical protein